MLDTQIEKMEHMVINERKYRVKISLAIYAREYTDRRVEIFEGLNGEEIQMQREKVEITNIALRKSDTLQLQEDLQLKEECPIDNIRRKRWSSRNLSRFGRTEAVPEAMFALTAAI